jgi:hypothetical protein
LIFAVVLSEGRNKAKSNFLKLTKGGSSPPPDDPDPEKKDPVPDPQSQNKPKTNYKRIFSYNNITYTLRGLKRTSAALLTPVIIFVCGGCTPIADPSGYVYEAVASNRLPGVTVTAYNGGAGSPAIWDAGQYDQGNPLITDEKGLYAWDVPFGQWQVKAEKAGYETAYSEWLPVPPPQTEVNIGMVSAAAPLVTGVKASEYYIKITFDKYMDTGTLTKQTVRLLGYSGGFDIVFANAEADPANPSAVYASVVRLAPKGGKFPSGEALNLSVEAGVKSYAGVPMGGAYETPVTVPGEPAGNGPSPTPTLAPPRVEPPYAGQSFGTSPAQPPTQLPPFKPLAAGDKNAQQRAADALYALKLFAGTGTDAAGKPIYDLDKALSRMEALAFVIRLKGLEKEAQVFTGQNPFTDMPAWGDRYAAYAFSIGLAVGINSAHTLFDPGRPVTAREFSAFLLRVLKFYEKDSDFVFEGAAVKASAAGILPAAGAIMDGGQNITRGNAAVMMLNALFAQENRSGAKLLDNLVKYGTVTETGARELQKQFRN